VFPGGDALFGHIARGGRAQPILSRRDFPYLMIDESSEITGHTGGVTGRFALRYGLCLAEFLAAPELPAGRFTCEASRDDWGVVRELLMPGGESTPDLAVDPSSLPAALAPLVGPRWAVLGDTLVLVAPVAGPRGVRLLYRSTGTAGGVLDAKIIGGSMRAVLPNKSTVTLSADGHGTITWTSSDGSQVLSAPLRRGEAR